MKKIKILSLICLFALIMSSMSASAKTNEYDIVKAKNELVSIAKEKSSEMNFIKKSTEELNHILLKMTSEQVSKNIVAKEMEKYGVYKLNIPEEFQSKFVAKSLDNSNISMSTPSIYYDSNNNQWVVVGGGYWKTTEWLDHVPVIWPGSGAEGSTYDVGNTDAFGVGFTSTNGNYNSSVQSSYAYISDGEGHEVTTSYRSDGNGSLGFGFRLQDKLRAKKQLGIYWPPDTSEFTYIGKHFAGLSRYDSNFSSYDGVATTYYKHTWEDAVVKSVSFGVQGKSAGVSFSMENEADSFEAFSADKRF